jgi:hypothetical protein
MPYFTPIDDKHQLADVGQAYQQFLHKRKVIPLIINPFVLDPPTVPLD